jgi:hypothetical protein
VQTDGFLSSWIRDNWYRQGTSASLACATCILSEIKTTEQLFRVDVALGSRIYRGQDFFRQIGKNRFQNIANGDIWTQEQLLLGGIFEPDELGIRWTGVRRIDNLLKRILAKPVERVAFNVGVAIVFDVGFEVFEYATGAGRWANPYWTMEQKLRQTGVSIGGDVAIVVVIALWNPELWPGIVVYGVASVAWSYIHPIIDPGAFTEYRNLKPLQP